MLETAVFLCGAVIMVVELTGSWVLAPYLETSLVVWTSLIGIILASLSLGYWWGGRLADRRPEARLLGRLILLASLATAAIALTKSLVLAYLQSKVTGLHMAAVLTLASWLAARSGGRTKAAAGALFLMVLPAAWVYDAQLRSAEFVDTDTAYNRVMIFKGAENSTGSLMSVMVTGSNAKQTAMYLDAPSALALPYTRYFRLVEHYVPELRRLLVLRGGGFSFPKKTTSLEQRMESSATNRF